MLTPRERAAVRFAEKLAVDHQKVDDALWAEVRAQFEAEVIELVAHTTLYIGSAGSTRSWGSTRPSGIRAMTTGRRLVIAFVVDGLRPDSSPPRTRPPSSVCARRA